VKMTELHLRQHGDPAVLKRSDYDGGWADCLTVLEKNRVLRVQQHETYVLVYPNQYAGNARCPAGRLRVEARFPDLHAELRRMFPLRSRLVGLPGHAAGADRILGSDAVAAFLSRLAEVVSVGIPFSYVRKIVSSATLSGSLDIARTIREFDSIGIHHLAVVRQARKLRSTALASVIYAVVELLEADGWLSVEEAAFADLLIAVLPDRSIWMTRSEALDAVDDLTNAQRDRPDVLALCSSAADILSDALSAEDLDYASDKVSFSFSDSDALWERAIHVCLNEAASHAGWRALLHPLRGRSTPLYPDGGPDIDPDVILYADETPRLVVDAKDYAVLGPDASGVYQIDSYARHLLVPRGALIYLTVGDAWRESFGDGLVTVEAIGIPADSSAALPRLRAACAALVAAI